MDKHCVSLELAKQLKEAGWKKETEFWWKSWKDLPSDKGYYIIVPKVNAHFTDYSAPLATEILEELHLVKIEKIDVLGFKCRCPQAKDLNGEFLVFHDLLLPYALAKMWLYLRKENLI